MTIAAMKQALEALYMANTRQWPENKIGAAINTLSAALAEPEQEPVAWRFHDGEMWCYVNHLVDLPAHKFEPLYTHPVDDTALLRQALEALETFQKISDFTPAQGVHAITALRERLGEKT